MSNMACDNSLRARQSTRVSMRVLLQLKFVDSILAADHRRRSTNLSQRQRQVLEALLDNLSNKEIANKLNMSERTAKFHVSNLLSRFDVRRRADLILLCYDSGLRCA